VRDWHDWYRQYDDPDSSHSRRLEVVRACLREVLTERPRARLLSLCAGDGRDTLPVLADFPEVLATLVEMDPDLAETARSQATDRVDVRTGDAGTTASYRDVTPVDLVMVCGVFGNIDDDDAERTVRSLADMLTPTGVVIWTRGTRKPDDPSTYADPSERVRALFAAAGFAERTYVCPDDDRFRVGVAELTATTPRRILGEQRLFTFR